MQVVLELQFGLEMEDSEEEEVSRAKAGRMGKVLKFVLELIEFE